MISRTNIRTEQNKHSATSLIVHDVEQFQYFFQNGETSSGLDARIF